MQLRSTIGAAALALGLAGCQTLNDVANSIASSDKSEAPPPAQVASETSTAPTAVGPRVASATGLSGMSADALRSAWGEPSLKRTDTGVELWQYGSAASCTLLVYLYPDAANTMTVSRAEAVPGGADDGAITACAKAAGKPPLKPIS